MNPLLETQKLGQSLWLDFIHRALLKNGGLARLVQDDGIAGVTSNPAIFEKAIGSGSDYDAALAAAVAAGQRDPATLFESLAIDDIRAAADVLWPVYQRTQGRDGFVSLEVAPDLAMDAERTVAEGQRLFKAVGRPNLMIKVPGTTAGARAVEDLTAAGINVNITLLFSRLAYRAVAEAHMAGLERRLAQGLPIAEIASVASFFVSRIDTVLDAEIDRRLAHDDAEAQTLTDLRGKIAIANAKLAYDDYLQQTQSARWQALAAKGARAQRLLWASTGTKNPAYSDVLYIETLIGPDTVNTVPPATLDAFRDHGQAAARLTQNIDDARYVLLETARLGLPLAAVCEQLVIDGIAQFEQAQTQLLTAVAAKRDRLLGG
ncbi:transaldolase [Sinimarinibacterium sp. NLF-5-8]|uniref:transaldolase n=1 Tax=Sinimarinibacterium sp. NLF-5-8 TaxID=2698684 RepID=UPI00137BAAA4|nr:transaldolase [Sinimarinibacterium sp. NLF-5-8]QHS09922.1 transaldolase [Sinimarinibacterium sp. NLF-5-8]